MKYLLFVIVTLMCSTSWGQVPITKRAVLILITQTTPNQLDKSAEQIFSNADVRQYLYDNGIQFVLINGNDTTPKWRAQNKVTHYPAVVYYLKIDKEYKLSRTVSGAETSQMLGRMKQVRAFLGMKAAPPQRNITSNNPLIPGSQSSPPSEYVQPQPQYSYPSPYNSGSS